jgi:hypothetical protein
MKTFNIEANMKTRSQFSVRAFAVTSRVVRQVLECGSPLPLSIDAGPFQSGRGLPHSKALSRWPQQVALISLLLVAWLAFPATITAQPTNYSDPAAVAAYVNGMLYWSANGTNNTTAAFRYKTLLYTNANGLAPLVTNMATLYTPADRILAGTAETYLVQGLSITPSSTLLGNLLLDLYYDRAAAEFILAANSLTGADRARMGPPSVPTGLVIDDEINLYRQALGAYRSALMTNFSLLSNPLGVTNVPPAGYQWFQQLVPSRSLAPASCLSNGVPISVTGDNTPLFTGYKDLVLLFHALRDYGRAAVPLAQLEWTRNNPGDLAAAKSLIADSQRFLYLQTSMLLAIFPGLDLTNGVDPASGLAEAVAGVNESQGELETMRQTILSGVGLLGFASDFLMLMQKFAGQSGYIFNSFDSFQSQLDPGNMSSPLYYAQSLHQAEQSSYDEYMGSLDQLNLQLENVTQSANDRLFQIVGAQPGTAAYTHPENNVGSEIWQQVQSIQAAQLRIKKNSVEVANLDQQIQIVENETSAINASWVQYGDEQVKLSDQIDKYKMAQEAADSAADALGDITEAVDNPMKLAATVANGLVQAGLEGAIGDLEDQKEQLAASQQGQIAQLQGQANIDTLRLNYNTLAVDSQEAMVLMNQEVGRLVALMREKADLESTLAENQQDLATRYFADPIHHLRYQHQSLLAHLSFDEAQKWLFFMVRALEYKWNTPFANYSYMGRTWSTSMLFKLRNADELTQFYNAMVSFNSLVQLPTDNYYSWFSVRDDFFGYKELDAKGNPALYPDPANPGGPATLTYTNAFQQKLKTLTNSSGTITLNFSTVRQKPGGTFFLGPRFDSNGNLLSAGLCMDKIGYIKINLPGHHTLGNSSTLAGQLTYGGNSFVRNFEVGSFVPGRPDLMTNEMTAYSTRYWFFNPQTASWQFSEALTSPVTMTLTNDAGVPPSVGEIDVFNERSVATTGWVLTIPTQDLGVPVMKIDELDDVELYFYHYAVSRQMPEGSSVATPSALVRGASLPQQNLPFPYYLKYYPNPEGGGK